MKRSVLIASAVAAVIASPVLAAGDWTQPIDEKCYGLSAKDLAACGAQGCASQASGRDPSAQGPANSKVQTDDQGQTYGLVPKGTCVKMYGGSLTPKKSS